MLTHYIIVRRDLPLGVLAAMVCHAAGESGATYERKEGWRYDDSTAFSGATAVILEAKDEKHLRQISAYLDEVEIAYKTVHESGGEYSGQLMALGLIPIEREAIAEKLREFQTLKTCLLN